MLASPSRRYQMRRVTIAVIGNGKTSRANVEALLNDTIESFDETFLALIYDSTPSEGVTWSKQYAESKAIPFKEYSALDFSGLTLDSKDREIKLFILWDDEDFECVEAIRCSQENSFAAFDLTNGLVSIKSVTTDIKPRTAPSVMPEVETKVSTDIKDASKYKSNFIKVTVSEDDEEYEEDEEEDEGTDEYESSDIIFEAIEEIAKIFAVAVASAIKEAMEKGPDESK
jgi:hypothetical protein